MLNFLVEAVDAYEVHNMDDSSSSTMSSSDLNSDNFISIEDLFFSLHTNHCVHEAPWLHEAPNESIPPMGVTSSSAVPTITQSPVYSYVHWLTDNEDCCFGAYIRQCAFEPNTRIPATANCIKIYASFTDQPDIDMDNGEFEFSRKLEHLTFKNTTNQQSPSLVTTSNTSEFYFINDSWAWVVCTKEADKVRYKVCCPQRCIVVFR